LKHRGVAKRAVHRDSEGLPAGAHASADLPAPVQTELRLRGLFVLFLMIGAMAALGGCSRLRPKDARTYVYVTAKEQFLRDRVAAVSNRTATVANGERLQVLERGRSHLRVQAANGATGWIDEKFVATQEVYDGFATLAKEHGKDSAVASAVVRDEVYLHLTPGRSTEKFYRLAEGDKLSLIARATLPKGGGLKAGPIRNPRQAAIPGAATGIRPSNSPGTSTPATPPPAPAARQSVAVSSSVVRAGAKPGSGAEIALVEPPPVVMEDWWLVRDGQGHVGWMLSRMMDVDAPDALSRYAEGQRIVGAYVLATVYDAGVPQEDKNVPEYVTVLSPYKAGLAYDFNQVRVFLWNPKMHRYETGFREKNMEGYLPVKLEKLQDPGGKSANAMAVLPGFSYKVLSAYAPPVVPDPETGAIVPGQTITKTYRLEGNLLRRLLPPGTPPPEEAHPEMELAKKEKKQARKRR
jgi:SH3-like domain-containing protein